MDTPASGAPQALFSPLSLSGDQREVVGKTWARGGWCLGPMEAPTLLKSGENLGYWVPRTRKTLTPEPGVDLGGGDQGDPIQGSQV